MSPVDAGGEDARVPAILSSGPAEPGAGLWCALPRRWRPAGLNEPRAQAGTRHTKHPLGGHRAPVCPSVRECGLVWVGAWGTQGRGRHAGRPPRYTHPLNARGETARCSWRPRCPCGPASPWPPAGGVRGRSALGGSCRGSVLSPRVTFVSENCNLLTGRRR